MTYFNFKVVGCCNCPYTNTDSWCMKSDFDTPEEFEAQNKDNYFSITETCPMFKEAKNEE